MPIGILTQKEGELQGGLGLPKKVQRMRSKSPNRTPTFKNTSNEKQDIRLGFFFSFKGADTVTTVLFLSLSFISSSKKA